MDNSCTIYHHVCTLFTNTQVAGRYAWERRLASMGPQPPSPCDPLAATLAIQEACAQDLVVGYATAMRFVVALDCAVSSIVEVCYTMHVDEQQKTKILIVVLFV